MDSNQWRTTQENNGWLLMRGDMGEMESSTRGQQPPPPPPGERKLARPPPQKDQAMNCPRCHSTNTKFCYYNNYSLTQPRYFCKTCRRYWTQGGTLRNVPVGGGSRKNNKQHHRSSTSSSSHKFPPADDNIQNPDQNNDDHDHFASTNPENKIMLMNELGQGQEYHLGNLGFPAAGSHHLYLTDSNQLKLPSSSSSSSASTRLTIPAPITALELLRTRVLGASGGMYSNFTTTSSSTGSMAPDLNAIYSTTTLNTSGFSFQELKPGAGIYGGVSFSVDHGLGSNNSSSYGNLDPRGGRGIQGNGASSGKLVMFPSAATANSRSSTEVDHDHNINIGKQLSNSNGFWSGMLGGTAAGTSPPPYGN